MVAYEAWALVTHFSNRKTVRSIIFSLYASFQLSEDECQQWLSLCTNYCELKMLSAWLCVLYWFFRAPSNLIQLWSCPRLEPEVGPGQPKLFCDCRMQMERNLWSQENYWVRFAHSAADERKGDQPNFRLLENERARHGTAENLQLPKSQFFTWNPSQCQNILFSQFCCVGSGSASPLHITTIFPQSQ